MTIVSFALAFVSIAIVGLQLFYPFHIVIGISIYILSFIPFALRIYLSRKTWNKYRAYSYTAQFFKKEKKVIFGGVLLFIFAFSFFVLRPMGGDTFAELSEDEIRQLVADDLYQSVTAIDYLETTGTALIESLQLETEDANTTELIEEHFNEYLRAVMFSESITDRHRYFADIPYRLWDERVVSFTISYSLYIKKYELLHRVMVEASGSEYKKKVLNQYIPLYERDKIYNEMVTRFYAPKTRIRINAGQLYRWLFAGSQDEVYGGAYTALVANAGEAYQYLLDNFDTTVIKSGEVVVDNTQYKMFDTWLPIQRGVANAMGHTILSERGDDRFISDDLIQEMQPLMEPGDIMLQRRNWNLSNIGIPGFWTHAALYTGNLDLMDEYFASEFPYQDYNRFSEYISDQYPHVYEMYQTLDSGGAEHSVIEAIEPGVVIQSLERSAHTDFVVTLRPELSKKDKMLALFKAFSHVGKPYDYNFDFDTRDAFVCSELVYDSYFPRSPEKRGILFETSTVNGRKIVSPIDIARKFKEEIHTQNQQLSFVLFIKGDEETKSASVSTQEEFIESIEWSKFSFLQ